MGNYFLQLFLLWFYHKLVESILFHTLVNSMHKGTVELVQNKPFSFALGHRWNGNHKQLISCPSLVVTFVYHPYDLNQFCHTADLSRHPSSYINYPLNYCNQVGINNWRRLNFLKLHWLHFILLVHGLVWLFLEERH